MPKLNPELKWMNMRKGLSKPHPKKGLLTIHKEILKQEIRKRNKEAEKKSAIQGS